MQELRRRHTPSLALKLESSWIETAKNFLVASATQSSNSLATLAGEDVHPVGEEVLEPPLVVRMSALRTGPGLRSSRAS